MSEAKAMRALQAVQKEAGQVRFLALLSNVLAVLLAFQSQFFTISNFSFLAFHQVAAPVAVLATFLQRGAKVAVVATVVAFLADIILFATSLISVLRCFYPNQASENCPDKLVQGSWLVVYSAQHILITWYEIMSLLRYDAALKTQLEVWETRLEDAKDADSKKRLVETTKRLSDERAAGVERRLSLFAFLPTVFFWVFCEPLALGWFAVLAGSRFLRDFFAVWYSHRMHRGTDGQKQFFTVLTSGVSGLFLTTSLVAWLYAEELADASDLSWDVLLDGATSAFADPFSWTVDGVNSILKARPEPFFLLFGYIEALVLANKNKPLR